MIARQKPPAALMACHSRNRLDDYAVFRTLRIENVPGDQNMRGLLGNRHFPDRIDCLEARLAQRRADLRLEPSEGLAQLPVGSVDEALGQFTAAIGKDWL